MKMHIAKLGCFIVVSGVKSLPEIMLTCTSTESDQELLSVCNKKAAKIIYVQDLSGCCNHRVKMFNSA